MRIYIACGLTHVPRDLFGEYSAFLHNLASALKECRKHAVKYALVNSDPQLANKPLEQRARLCYLWDREMVEEAELVIAEVSFPSTGLGIELQVAEQSGTPIILCFRDFGCNRTVPVEYVNPDHSQHELQIGEGFVSLMALGIPSVLSVVRYGDSADGITEILDAVALLER
ncbi:hypothetical protein [Rhodospirillaceae bacterium SYSU D60014]|uniref:hypothetical protein n=1 Tax=Virgifigura deserti TaxID=2268457 RepID=UPI0013C3FCCA